MAEKRKSLGRGLSALISNTQSEVSEQATNTTDVNFTNSVVMLKITEISPNNDQPRKHFEISKLEELSESIKANGIIQPILVTKIGDKSYKIVAGERRWRAARMAKLEEVPVIIKELTDDIILEQALIENIQREDLNPIEEADALYNLMNAQNLTQEDLAKRVGKSRSAIANSLRLIQAPDELKRLVIQNDITAGHARALLILPLEDQLKLATKIVSNELSVRETEKLVKKYYDEKNDNDDNKNKNSNQKNDLHNEQYLRALKETSDILSKRYGTKVELKEKNNKGQVIINYYDADDRERIIETLNRL